MDLARRPSHCHHYRRHRPADDAVIRPRQPTRIPPDLLNRTLHKRRPSLRCRCRIAEQMLPHLQAKYAARIRTRAMGPGAGPFPFRRLPHQMRPHRIVLHIPQKRLIPGPIQKHRIKTRRPVHGARPAIKRVHPLRSPAINRQGCHQQPKGNKSAWHCICSAFAATASASPKSPSAARTQRLRIGDIPALPVRPEPTSP